MPFPPPDNWTYTGSQPSCGGVILTSTKFGGNKVNVLMVVSGGAHSLSTIIVVAETGLSVYMIWVGGGAGLPVSKLPHKAIG